MEELIQKKRLLKKGKKNLKAEKKKRIVKELKGGGMSTRGLGKAFRGGGLA